MIAFEDEAYGEMVLHPPPVSYISAMLIPFVFSRVVMRFISKGFSYFMHWIENTVFICGFLLFEVVLAPLTYVKVWINLIASSVGLLKTVVNCLVWVILGVPMIIFIILRDAAYLIKILSYHQGCRDGKADELNDDDISQETRERIYNEIRNTVIALYKRLKRHISQDASALDEKINEEELIEDVDVF